MLNIKSKKEAVRAGQENLKRFTDLKNKIIEENLKRDESIIFADVLPQLRQRISLEKYTRGLDYFRFTLPLISFDGFVLTQKEKDAITHSYYHQVGTLWFDNCGETSKASLVKGVFSVYLDKEVLFKSCDIDSTSRTVDFSFRLILDNKKFDVEEELAYISSKLDEHLLPHMNFQKIADKINGCYQVLSEQGTLAVFQHDLNSYEVLSINVDDIIAGSNFFAAMNLENENVKIDVRYYVKNSKLLKSLERKLRNYGYVLRVNTTSSKNDAFRHHFLELSIDANYASKKVKDTSLVKSETLYEAFQQKKVEYDEVIYQQLTKQNDALISLVESGHFDKLVAMQWIKGTLMSAHKLTSYTIQGDGNVDEIKFIFRVPFDRDIPSIKPFKHTHHKASAVGSRYMNMEGNIVDALRRRYPFFSRCSLIGNPNSDFRERDDEVHLNKVSWKSGTLAFGFLVGRTNYISNKKNILEWLSSSYGLLDIDPILKENNFSAEDVSQKIEDYIDNQTRGKDNPQHPFKLVLATVDSEDILPLYQKSPLYEKSKALFECNHENDIRLYSNSNTEYKELKKKELQSLKLGNHFIHALLLHPVYRNLKESLEELDYKLSIELNEVHKRRVDTGSPNLVGGTIQDNVCLYSAQLVIE